GGGCGGQRAWWPHSRVVDADLHTWSGPDPPPAGAHLPPVAGLGQVADAHGLPRAELAPVDQLVLAADRPPGPAEEPGAHGHPAPRAGRAEHAALHPSPLEEVAPAPDAAGAGHGSDPPDLDDRAALAALAGAEQVGEQQQDDQGDGADGDGRRARGLDLLAGVALELAELGL